MVKIRLDKTDSLHSVNKENKLDVSLNSTSKIMKYNNIKKTIDSYEVYKDERKKCNRYRLILTINPLCSNVLFNPLTEIAKYTATNGGVKIERVTDNVSVNGVDGDTSQRVQYVANTTYSNDEYGYTYYPGYDIFDNHILRSKGFNVVNYDKSSSSKVSSVFNTLCDFARNKKGEIINIFKRTGVATKPKQVKKHIYNYDTLMSWEDSINYNLSEMDGWLGFPNVTKLKTYYTKSNDSKNEKATNWNRVLNNHSSDEFVQMYPDRSTYTFTPYHNSFLNRLEYNWDILITYPYMNDYDHELVKFNDINALQMLSAESQAGISGENIIMFRSYTKHNLVRNDYVRVMWENDGSIHNEQYRVSNVGNLHGEGNEYYFYIDDPTLVTEFEKINDPEKVKFYIQKITGGLASRYYLRKFRKLDYGGNTIVKEQYNLAFATTIYNDSVTQITFTDTLDFTDVTDNLGRPVCEFYVTILKTNRGNKEWYDKESAKSILVGDQANNVEISHCFTKLTDGFAFHCERSENNFVKSRQLELNNIRYIDGSNAGANEKDKWLSESKQPEHITKSDDWKDWHGISKDQEWFYGDVVEFIPSDYKEYVIANVNYRFNSYQRENPNKNFVCDGVLRYHNIISDDYDFNADFKIDDVYKYTYAEQEPRREGYFYNPHYPIRMKEEGEVQQGSHYTVRARNVIVVQDDDIRLKVVSMQTSNVNVNDIVLLMDDKNSQMFEFIVVYIESSNTFYITPRNGWFGDNGFIEQTAQIYEAPLVWSDVAELLRRGENMFIRRRNIEIPSYAVLAGRNIFLWRNYYNNGELLNGKIPEYIFTNNAFYVTPVINFYVKRQDPNGYFGLYTPETQNPQDIAGETKKPSNYSYNDPETKATC